MRIYLSVKQEEYNPGFYPSGRVPEELAQKWVGEGIACPATDDNHTMWPNGGPEPAPESPESVKAREDAHAAAAMAPDTGLILNDEVKDEEEYDNG